jgi:hypothetical protein
MSVWGLLLEMGVTVEGEGWELMDTISSLLLFWFMEASLKVALEKYMQLKYTRSSVEYSIVKAF